MFGQIPHTPYDLHFEVIGIPVRIHPGFFLLAAIIGYSPGWAAQLDVNYLMPILLFTIVVFISVLVHELGHAVTARRFGWPPRITLYYFGGLASYQPTHGYTPTRRVLIALAGPGAGFVLFGIFYVIEQYIIRNHVVVTPIVGYLIVQFKFVNLWWGLLNLLPIYPLDGGQVAEQVCRKINPYRGMENTFKLGIIVAVAVAIIAWQRMGQTYMALMFLFLAFNNYQFLEQTRGRGGPGSPW